MYLLDAAASILVKITLILALTLLTIRALANISAAKRHQIWIFALAAILIVPLLDLLPLGRLVSIRIPSVTSLESFVQATELANEPIQPGSITFGEFPAGTTASQTENTSPQLIAGIASSHDPTPSSDHSVPPLASRTSLHQSKPQFSGAASRNSFGTAFNFALILWGCGTLVYLFELAKSLRAIRRLSRESHVVTDPLWLRSVEQVARKIKLKRTPRLLRSAQRPLDSTSFALRPGDLLVPSPCALRGPGIGTRLRARV